MLSRLVQTNTDVRVNTHMEPTPLISWPRLLQKIISWKILARFAHESCGGFRKGGRPLAREAHPKIFGLPRPLLVTLKVRTELEATLGLAKRLEISKELIRECVTVPKGGALPLA